MHPNELVAFSSVSGKLGFGSLFRFKSLFVLLIKGGSFLSDPLSMGTKTMCSR